MIEIITGTRKKEYLNKIKPNLIQNRFDLRYGENFEILHVTYKNKNYYLEYHIRDDYYELGCYFMEIPSQVLKLIISFFKKQNKNIKWISVEDSLNKCPTTEDVGFYLRLPDTVEQYDSLFSSKSRSTKKRAQRQIDKLFHPEYVVYTSKKITPDLIQEFLRLKNVEYTVSQNNKYEDLISSYWNITHAFCIYIDKKLAALFMYSALDNKTLFAKNTAYDIKYQKYGIGNVCFYYSIEELIKLGFKHLYLGNGHYLYKEKCKAKSYPVWSGFFC